MKTRSLKAAELATEALVDTTTTTTSSFKLRLAAVAMADVSVTTAREMLAAAKAASYSQFRKGSAKSYARGYLFKKSAKRINAIEAAQKA